MLLRSFITLLCLAPLAWYLDREQGAGRFQRLDDWFLDFLVANARERLEQPDAQAPNQVVFVRVREEDAAEYAAWPPPPLDWQTLLKALAVHDPDVLVIATPLSWGRPVPDFVPAVAEALLRFPSVVLAVEAQQASAASDAPAFLGGLDAALPRFQRIDGGIDGVPGLAALVAAPDEMIRPRGELGLISQQQDKDGTWRVPYALKEGATIMPCLTAQALARHSRTPYARHRIRLGPGAGAFLSGGLFVPLQPDGTIGLPAGGTLAVVNALDLMAGALAEGASADAADLLGHGKIIVIGLDSGAADAAPSPARLHAQALALALALPRLRVLNDVEQWIVWTLALLAGLWIVAGGRRQRALRHAFGLIFLALVFGFVMFQSSLVWSPPTIPAAMLAASGLLGSVLGRKDRPIGSEAAEPRPLSRDPTGGDGTDSA